MTIGQQIRQARNQMKLTQEQLAHKVGVTTQHMAMVERGERSPSHKLLKKLADLLLTDFVVRGS